VEAALLERADRRGRTAARFRTGARAPNARECNRPLSARFAKFAAVFAWLREKSGGGEERDSRRCGAPEAIVERLTAAVNAALRDEGVRKGLADQAQEPVGGNGRNYARWLVKELNITIE
jgi:hypothetical protein